MGNHTRRTFLGRLLAVVGTICVWPLVRQLKRIPRPTFTPISIAQLIAISFESVRSELRKNASWCNIELNQAQQRGDIVLMSFPAISTYATASGQHYPIEECATALVWSRLDEARNVSKNNKISLAAALLENGILAHEDSLLALLETHRLVVSREYRCERGEVQQFDAVDSQGTAGYVCKLYTTLIRIPKAA